MYGVDEYRGIERSLTSFLSRVVKKKYPEVNEIIVQGRDIGNGNFDYTIMVHPTWDGVDRLNSDENFELELFDYVKTITQDGIYMLTFPNKGHYFNKVDWFWD